MSDAGMIKLDTIVEADQRIKAVPDLVYETPLTLSQALSDATGVEVWLKCEHLQQTGSFKLRGATNKILCLSELEKTGGVITASTGNHGMGVALAARLNRVPVRVVVPENASEIKLATIQGYGAGITKVPGDALQAELAASALAKSSGVPFISPYNDLEIIAGQGSVGLEIVNHGQAFDDIFVSVGGGGLVSGIGSCVKQKAPATKIHGCWPANAPAMYHCLAQGAIIDVDETGTLSDGTAGGVEPGAVTFPICREVIDHKVLVTEEEIKEAIRLAARAERFIIEGAAGVALAGFLQNAGRFKGRKVVVVLCGRNILFEKFLKVIS